MKLKRLMNLLLAVALLATLALPVGAASNSSFSDISDETTAVNADILRLMGVVSGSGNNQFSPKNNLTRGEFCAMVVQFMGLGDKVVLHSTRTIFSDVTASHWALGYVNLAASTTTGGEGASSPLISGVGNGQFMPNANITFAQATTILIRVLGYSNDQVGTVWPQSHLNLARSIGLSDGLSASANTPITRAQAAQLFVNALGCKTGAGAQYYTSLGTASDDVVFLSVNVTTDDGSQEGAIRTSSGTYLPSTENVKPTALQGKRGALVLDDRSEVVTFIPDNSTATTISISGSAQPSYVKSTGGTQYTISSNTPVYTSDKEESSDYISAYSSLKSGTQLTLFTERGKVVAIYALSGTTASTDAIVVQGSASKTDFYALTGGASNYTIMKNRHAITINDIEENDVVTYDSMTNTLVVSDLRLGCVYENASPNAKAPATIKILGADFDVLESAWDSIQDFSIGNSVCLLLTADGKVAGMEKPTSSLRSTAVGIATSTTQVNIFLPNGSEKTLTATSGNISDTLIDRVVSVSSSSKGRLSASNLSGTSVSNAFDLDKMTVGKYTVTTGVRIFEKVGTGAQVEINMADLDMDTIAANKIAVCHLNSSGMVDYLVLEGVTGDAYVYGKLIMTAGVDVSEDYYQNRTVTVENGSGGLDNVVCALSFKNGSFGGVVQGQNDKAISVIALTEIKKVSPSDFSESGGRQYVKAGGKTYLISNDVECYLDATDSWLSNSTGAERLSSCKAFGSSFTIHVDSIGNKVRIIEAS